VKETDKELVRIRQKKLKEMLRKLDRGVRQTTVRIVIPVVDESGLSAQLSRHFGRAPYFAVVELDAEGRVTNQRSVPNVSEHFGGAGRSAHNILELKPNAVITFGMGQRGLDAFQNAGVAVLRANADIGTEVIKAYNNDELEELTEGCHQAHHR
jgi:predicted Fe-Mo cluster-binding NifX family protein